MVRMRRYFLLCRFFFLLSSFFSLLGTSKFSLSLLSLSLSSHYSPLLSSLFHPSSRVLSYLPPGQRQGWRAGGSTSYSSASLQRGSDRHSAPHAPGSGGNAVDLAWWRAKAGWDTLGSTSLSIDPNVALPSCARIWRSGEQWPTGRPWAPPSPPLPSSEDPATTRRIWRVRRQEARHQVAAPWWRLATSMTAMDLARVTASWASAGEEARAEELGARLWGFFSFGIFP